MLSHDPQVELFLSPHLPHVQFWLSSSPEEMSARIIPSYTFLIPAGPYQSVWILGFLCSYQDLLQVLLALLRTLVILWHQKLCLVPSENPPVLWPNCHTMCLCPEAVVLSNAKWLDMSLKEKLFNCSADADTCDACKRNWDFAHSNSRSAFMPTEIHNCLYYRLYSQ